MCAHPESAERTLARYGGDEGDLDGYESVVSTASATAAASGGFPAFLLPAIAEKWTASFAPSLRGYVVAEQLMLERLPQRLLGFADLAELARTDAAAALREELSATRGNRAGSAGRSMALPTRSGARASATGKSSSAGTTWPGSVPASSR